MPQLIHALDSHIDLIHDDVQLFSYVYHSRVPAIESPRPYFHPLRTLKGNIVSGFRPHDHRWHHGLSMTCANLSGHNFWGGPTYLRDEGYVQLENNGKQGHDSPFQSWERNYPPIEGAIDGVTHWFAPLAKEPLLKNFVTAGFVVEENFWTLNLNFSIENKDNGTNPQNLIWGSPTTQGRDNAGYGGLFWRGPRDFMGGQILMSDGREGADLMGQTSPWLAYIGQHDETDDYSTLIFIDDDKNPRHPTPWFARNTTPMVCPYFAFHEEYEQKVGESLNLNYRIIIADGKWDRQRIEAVV